MKRLAIFLSLLATNVIAADVRTWTSADGRTLDAALSQIVTSDKGEAIAVKVRPPGQRDVELPLDSLAEADQDFVKEQARVELEEKRKAALANRRAKWTEDWEEAQLESKETGLPIFLLITGSDWCGYCIALHDKVLDDREFEKYANQNLVLMKADFPHGSQRRSTREQNAKLKDEFGGGGYPTVVLIKDGTSVGRIGGYGGDSPEEYVAKIVDRLQ